VVKITVIIVNYNVAYFLEQCLHSVKKALQHVQGEVIVVDNNSVDGSVAMVQQKFPEFNLIANKQNTGFSFANNQALKIAKGSYCLLLNPDTVVEEDTFKKVVEFMDAHDDAGGLGVKMIDGKGNFLPESKRGLPTPAVAFYKIFGLSFLFPQSKIFGKYHLGYLDKEKTHEIEYIKDVVIVRTDASGSGIASSYNIIQEMKYSSKEQSYVIVLSSLYAEYFNKTMSINYNKRFDELISIRGKGSAFIRSIIEFFITHDASAENIQRMKLIQLLETINYPCETPRQISSAKQYLKDYEDELAKFNIKYYSGSQLFEYSGTTDIRFIPPLEGLID
jgi:glycosyltransferase involved in cell wall biosynthesis